MNDGMREEEARESTNRYDQCAAQPAAVHPFILCKRLLPCRGINFYVFRVFAVPEVMYREQVKMVHDLDQMGCADLPHVILLGVVVGNLVIDPFARFSYQVGFCRVIA